MNSWVYFNSKFETLASGKSTTVIILGIGNFLHCQIYKSSFCIFLNTDQQADSVHICFHLLSVPKLLLQRFWHLRGRRAREPEVDLHGVIDEPLQCSQSANHDDTGKESLPYTWIKYEMWVKNILQSVILSLEGRKKNLTSKSKSLEDQRRTATLLFIQHRHHRISRVRNNGTEDSSWKKVKINDPIWGQLKKIFTSQPTTFSWVIKFSCV